MSGNDRDPEPPPPADADTDSRLPALAGLVLMILLIAGVFVLATVMRREARLQDCMISGRMDCGSP